MTQHRNKDLRFLKKLSLMFFKVKFILKTVFVFYEKIPRCSNMQCELDRVVLLVADPSQRNTTTENSPFPQNFLNFWTNHVLSLLNLVYFMTFYVILFCLAVLATYRQLRKRNYWLSEPMNHDGVCRVATGFARVY